MNNFFFSFKYSKYISAINEPLEIWEIKLFTSVFYWILEKYIKHMAVLDIPFFPISINTNLNLPYIPYRVLTLSQIIFPCRRYNKKYVLFYRWCQMPDSKVTKTFRNHQSSLEWWSTQNRPSICELIASKLCRMPIIWDQKNQFKLSVFAMIVLLIIVIERDCII